MYYINNSNPQQHSVHEAGGGGGPTYMPTPSFGAGQSQG